MRPLVVAVILLFVSSRAGAQPYLGSKAPRAGSFEIGGSVVWSGGYDAGSHAALETPNGSAGTPGLTLFTTSSEVASAAGFEGRLGIYISPQVSVEGSFQYTRPVLRTSIRDDFENASPLTAEETVTSYLAGGTLLYHFGRGRVVPFVGGGGAYVRQLHEDNAEIITGSEFHGGGGVKLWFGKGLRRLGVRLDAQASSRSKSVGFEDKRRLVPVVSGGLTYLF